MNGPALPPLPPRLIDEYRRMLAEHRKHDECDRELDERICASWLNATAATLSRDRPLHP